MIRRHLALPLAALALSITARSEAQPMRDASATTDVSADAAIDTPIDVSAARDAGASDAGAPVATDATSGREGADEVAEGEAFSESPLRATEIAALSPRQCLRALARARVPFERLRWGSSGMATPVVVTGPIAGILVHAGRGAAPRETMDCLLAVALVRYAGFLRAHGVREVRHLSLHRPATAAEVASRPLLPRHPGGLAIDAAVFVRDDGSELNVTRDFRGHLGDPVCGPTARVSNIPEARAIRAIFCDAVRDGLFHVALSPNFNDEHRNHFHLEIARSVSWLFVR